MKINEETVNKLNSFTKAYLEAALWSSSGGADEKLNEKTIYDFAPEALAAVIKDCGEFSLEAASLLSGWTNEQAGHDFWLTRCGHGAGFWDRGMEHGQALTRMVGHGTKYPPLDIYVGDDGLVYGMGEVFEPDTQPQPVAA